MASDLSQQGYQIRRAQKNYFDDQELNQISFVHFAF